MKKWAIITMLLLGLLSVLVFATGIASADPCAITETKGDKSPIYISEYQTDNDVGKCNASKTEQVAVAAASGDYSTNTATASNTATTNQNIIDVLSNTAGEVDEQNLTTGDITVTLPAEE